MQHITSASDRIKARWIPAGYTIYREIPGAIVYASPDKLQAIAYRGSAMKSEFNYRFRNAGDLDRECEKLFERVKAHQEWKERQKKERSNEETETQKVKKALKNAGYNVTSCHRDRGTAYGWIDITIDDYESPIIDGKLISQYGKVQKIAYGICHDGNQCIQFTKHHKCEDCLISNCDKYHTPDMCACPNFTNKEISDRDARDYAEYKAQADKERTEREAYEKTPEYLKIKQEEEDLKRADTYREECEANREMIGYPWVYDGQGNRHNTVGPSSLDPVKLPYEVKEITLDMDGTKTGKKYFGSFQSASAYLLGQEATFPSTGGYDKINFKILFIDGEDYSGRLDVKGARCPDNDLNVLDHVLTHCEWYAGRAKNPYCGPDEYKEIVKGFTEEKKKACADFIDKYLLPVKPEVPTFEICRGCPDYAECQGGHPEDCERGYLDLVRSEMPPMWVRS